MRSKARFLGKAAFKLAFALVAVAVMGGVVMLLWNTVAPALFLDARLIDYLHALGLLILCRILFGGFRGHGGWRGHRQWGKRQAMWRAMTPEEREQFKQSGRGGPFGKRPGDQS